MDEQTEDREVIMPAIKSLPEAGVNATGPHPADTLFHEEARQTYDAVLGMYVTKFLSSKNDRFFWKC